MTINKQALSILIKQTGKLYLPTPHFNAYKEAISRLMTLSPAEVFEEGNGDSIRFPTNEVPAAIDTRLTFPMPEAHSPDPDHEDVGVELANGIDWLEYTGHAFFFHEIHDPENQRASTQTARLTSRAVRWILDELADAGEHPLQNVDWSLYEKILLGVSGSIIAFGTDPSAVRWMWEKEPETVLWDEAFELFTETADRAKHALGEVLMSLAVEVDYRGFDLARGRNSFVVNPEAYDRLERALTVDFAMKLTITQHADEITYSWAADSVDTLVSALLDASHAEMSRNLDFVHKLKARVRNLDRSAFLLQGSRYAQIKGYHNAWAELSGSRQNEVRALIHDHLAFLEVKALSPAEGRRALWQLTLEQFVIAKHKAHGTSAKSVTDMTLEDLGISSITLTQTDGKVEAVAMPQANQHTVVRAEASSIADAMRQIVEALRADNFIGRTHR